MTAPRFYQLTLRGGDDATRVLAIDLLDGRDQRAAPEVVRALSETVRGLDPAWRARTAYVDAPAPGATLHPLGAYRWASGDTNAPRLERHLRALRELGRIHRFEIRTGNWAEGVDLVGREATVSRLASALGDGARVHLMAPRRYGKTSIVRAVQDRLEATGRVVLRFDVESVEDVASFLVRLVDEAFQVTDALRPLDALSDWPSREADPMRLAEACRALRRRVRASPLPLLRQVCAALAGHQVIVLIDEFTRFVLQAQQRDTASMLCAAMSALAETPALSLLVCGSQGLRGFIAWHALDALRGLQTEVVEPLLDDDARVLVEELFYGANATPSPEAVREVLARVGAPVPYFLHGLVHHALQEHRARFARDPLGAEVVGRAYVRRMLDEEGNEFFRPFRLKERGYPDGLREAAAMILRTLSRSDAAVSLAHLRDAAAVPAESFELLMTALAEDYDIVVDGDLTRLRSKVMRERWARREAWIREDAT